MSAKLNSKPPWNTPRSVGRPVETDLVAALRKAAVVTEARSVLADRRGSTDEERAAAETWLADTVRDEQPRAPHVE